MSWSTDGGPERLGRALGRAVVRGRVVARQLAGSPTGEQVVKAGRSAAERAQPKVRAAAGRARQELAARGPDVAEQAAQRAVDRAFWVLGARSGALVTVIRPLAQPARNAAGVLARDLARAAGGSEDAAATPPPDPTSRPLPAPPEGGEGRAGGPEPPASSA